MAKVSIGLPVYNGENYLSQAIDGILAQTFRDFELIICDNASTDGTQAICEAAAAADPRIRYVRHPENLGAAPNFNSALDLATAPYFKWAAHDDICLPDYLARCVAVLDRDADVVACHSRTDFIDAEGTVLAHYEMETDRFDLADPVRRFANAIQDQHWCITIFSVIRRDALLKTSRIASYIGSDRSVIAQLALQGRLVHVPEVLFLSRDHGERSIRALDLNARSAWFDSAQSKGRRGYWGRMFREHVRSLFRYPIPLHQRLRGFGSLLYWLRYNRRALMAELASRPK